MRVIAVFILTLSSMFVVGQNDPVVFPDKEASFPGGSSELTRFIGMETQYPEEAIINGDEGKVYVFFIIEKDGALSNVEVHREGVSPALNAEAIRVVRSMPNWLPAELEGEPVRSKCRLAVSFVLDRHISRKNRRKLRRKSRRSSHQK